MSQSEKSCLICEEQEMILEAYGKEKADALGTIFSLLKKQVYKEIKGLIIHMEPVDVFMLEEDEKKGTDKLIGLMKPRQNQSYYAKVKIIIRLKYIPL